MSWRAHRRSAPSAAVSDSPAACRRLIMPPMGRIDCGRDVLYLARCCASSLPRFTTTLRLMIRSFICCRFDFAWYSPLKVPSAGRFCAARAMGARFLPHRFWLAARANSGAHSRAAVCRAREAPPRTRHFFVFIFVMAQISGLALIMALFLVERIWRR